MKKSTLNRIIPALLLVIVFLMMVIMVWFLVTTLNLTSLQKLGAFIVKWKAWGPVVLMVLSILAALTGLIPAFPLALLSGAIWGVPLGTLYMVVGTQIGAVLSFLISRHAAYPIVEKFFGKQLRVYQKIDEKYLTVTIFVTRLLPIFVFEIISYAAGLTKIKFWNYFWATLIGMIPLMAFLAWSGQSALTEGGPMFFIITGIALVILIILPWLIQKHDPFGIKKKIFTS